MDTVKVVLSSLDTMLKSVRKISAFAVMAGGVLEFKIGLGSIGKALWYSCLNALSI